MPKVILLHFFIFFGFLAFAQDTTLTIYFKSGQSRLTALQQNSVNKLQQKPVTKITVDGYADTVGKASSNKKLSYKRAQTTASTIKTSNKNVVGNGECKEKKLALNKMRKVVIKVWYDKPAPQNKPADPIEEKKQSPPPPPVVDLCLTDTTFYSESGTMIKMNKCYYKKIKTCFKYKEYLTAKSVQQAGLRTVDEKGDPIESGGMIDIRFCSDTCVKTPVIIFLPVPKCLSQQPMTLWMLNRQNAWKNSKNKIQIVKIDGKEFYKIEVYCPGRLNCDRPKPTHKKVKVKIKNGLKIRSASLSYNCPLYSINAKIKRKGKLAVFPYICPQDEPLLHLKAFTKTHDTLVINNTNINEYTRKRKLLSHCACNTQPKEKFLNIFKIRKKYLYKKYKIFKKDFPLTN